MITRVALRSAKRSLPRRPFSARAGEVHQHFISATTSVHVIPVLEDNYSYLVVDNDRKTSICIDPAEPLPIINLAETLGVSIEAILTTHKHADHTLGNEAIRDATLCKVFAPADGDVPIPAVTNVVCGGDCLRVGAHKILVLNTPCHTSGHVTYCFVSQPITLPSSLLFPGDTLFVGGCGRFFEGTGKDMVLALRVIMEAVPEDALMFCGHEYTVSNLQFAASIEPNNTRIHLKLAEINRKLANGIPSVPSSLAEERLYNPFLRIEEPDILKALGLGPDDSRSDVMSLLRQRKDNF